MSWKWISSSHPVSDIRDWSNQQRLEIRPDFQRKEVWSPAARILLMDTILRNIPMPKVFLQAVIRDNDTYRVVIDGQQRIKAILAFMRDEFKLSKPYSGEFYDQKFSDLPITVREEFLSYKVDINEIRNAPDDVVRDIYSRVNKYTVALNKQELRRADFPGEFLRLSEELATDPFFEDAKIFTVTNSKRMGDVEFVSELLALLLKGPQEKRETLDDLYLTYMEWAPDQRELIKQRFSSVLLDFQALFTSPNCELGKTRFRQKADFYSLFGAIDDCHREGGSLVGKPLEFLMEDIRSIDCNTAPESEVRILSHYAVQCVSQANSSASRTWRRDFLRHFIDGTYFQRIPNAQVVQIFHEYLDDVYNPGMCPAYAQQCPVCDAEIADYSKDQVFLTWAKSEIVYQLSNAVFIHNRCREAAREHFIVAQLDALPISTNVTGQL